MPDIPHRPLRKSREQIADPAVIADVLKRGQVLRLAMCLGDQPYLVPLNYAYQDGRLYLHTGREGLKMDILRANPKVCFEVTVDAAIVTAAQPCKWDFRYLSVLGFGRAVELSDEAQRSLGLELIVAHYAGQGPHELTPAALERACVLRVDIEALTCKHHQP